MLTGNFIRSGGVARGSGTQLWSSLFVGEFDAHNSANVSQSSTILTMTTDFTDDEMSSTTDFETALGNVILTALQNDIDPWGTWEYRTDRPDSDTEVMVVRLAE